MAWFRDGSGERVVQWCRWLLSCGYRSVVCGMVQMWFSIGSDVVSCVCMRGMVQRSGKLCVVQCVRWWYRYV